MVFCCIPQVPRVHSRYKLHREESLKCPTKVKISTTKNTDKIIILDNGQIIQQGSHNQLINQTGYYKELYEQQVDLKQVPEQIHSILLVQKELFLH